MPRPHRHFLPGRIWHITHRAHKKEFLLRFRTDKRRWIRWTIEAKRRYSLTVLNFMITSNHIHFLVMDRGAGTAADGGRNADRAARAPHVDLAPRADRGTDSASAIPSALRLIESRVAEPYNARKDRDGAFWDGRYHATTIESGPQLARCLTYIDMNMVRAGVVGHPRDWPWCGYHELGRELGREAAGLPVLRRRSFVVDIRPLLDLLDLPDAAALFARRSEWIDAAIRKGRLQREALWTESVAVGSEKFLEAFQSDLGPRLGAAEICKDDADGDLLYLKRTRGNPIVVFGQKTRT